MLHSPRATTLPPNLTLDSNICKTERRACGYISEYISAMSTFGPVPVSVAIPPAVATYARASGSVMSQKDACAARLDKARSYLDKSNRHEQ